MLSWKQSSKDWAIKVSVHKVLSCDILALYQFFICRDAFRLAAPWCTQWYFSIANKFHAINYVKLWRQFSNPEGAPGTSWEFFGSGRMKPGGPRTLYSKSKFYLRPWNFQQADGCYRITCEVVAKCLAPLHPTSQLDMEDRPRQKHSL